MNTQTANILGLTSALFLMALAVMVAMQPQKKIGQPVALWRESAMTNKEKLDVLFGNEKQVKAAYKSAAARKIIK